MEETTMSSRGQVVIPVRIRRALGLEKNDRFQVEQRDGCIVLRPVQDDDWRSLRGSSKGKSLTRWLEKERRREMEKEG